MKGNRPPVSGLSLERNGDSKRSAVFSPGKGEEPGRRRAVKVGEALVRHKLLPDFIGPGQEQELQWLADEFGRFPLEQSGTNGLRGHDEPGLVNRYGDLTPLKLGRGITVWLDGGGPSGIERWFR